MTWWDSYRAVHGAELRAAAREFTDHGWPVAAGPDGGLLLRTGEALDVLEVPAGLGRRMCARLRAAGVVVPVAATPADRWWFPVTTGAVLPAALGDSGAMLHAAGSTVLAPPSEIADGWVHWRVSPARTGYRLPAVNLILDSAADGWRTEHDFRPGAQRPVALVVAGMRT